jgi:predicted RNA-binding protein YlqC (UPF0109 family)
MQLIELLETILENMISDTEAMRVDVSDVDNCLVFEIDVPPEETGKVIGRQGNTANSIRTILRCAAAKQDIRKDIALDILEDPNYRRKRRYNGGRRGYDDRRDHRNTRNNRYRDDY